VKAHFNNVKAESVTQLGQDGHVTLTATAEVKVLANNHELRKEVSN
jgi:hypothetical protein